jgi:hypothetical protein
MMNHPASAYLGGTQAQVPETPRASAEFRSPSPSVPPLLGRTDGKGKKGRSRLPEPEKRGPDN